MFITPKGGKKEKMMEMTVSRKEAAVARQHEVVRAGARGRLGKELKGISRGDAEAQRERLQWPGLS